MIKQGDIFFANLNPTKGHEQSGMRPVIVLQNSILNKHLNTVIIAPITGNLQAKNFMLTFFLPKGISKLPKDSVALLFQMRCIDKARLQKKCGKIPEASLGKMKRKLSRLF
ncbi:type II toxin-antitoxin system PemK/MazF family toxin [Candidatus Peregrinibacteria bacterium]|jgi:mRNA interferase MazF|nr:type II toxin-antitoxin system PemK/MazF family toxin [Candidatus Peregrinibacteria bacterium]MBT4631788.1 type II toxin-antitoxin system PemK/MazF family toxin [Candidatus Peregrinibacteria bacterium]MBT5516851.1 type II toxin-antitoxin system PemK/MazF family toxin [Candidatus Peregrinibacteria bacterium]MBT5824487.1 type II toxin-antitoxin system PemK/MazF family toxin [Candidatus Peregrinibacteria bacterium]